MKNIKIVLYGGGGVAIEVARYIKEINEKRLQDLILVTDIVDDSGGRVDDLNTLLGYAVSAHKTPDTVSNVFKKKFIVALGHSPFRDEKFNVLKEKGYSFYTVIHPSAEVSHVAKIGDGCIIAPFALVGAFATLADNVLLNVRSTVGHDTVLGRSCIVSPHVDISGGVMCGRSVFFGAGTVINPGLSIGQFAKTSSGSIITADVGAGSLVYGNPASGHRVFNPRTGRSLFGGSVAGVAE